MPTYSYRCTECGTAFDIQQSFTDASLTVCPTCSGVLRKVFSPVGVSFTGSGFYRNDSRATPEAGKKGAESGAGAGTEKSAGSEKGAGSEKSSGTGSGGSASSGSGSTSDKAPARREKSPAASGAAKAGAGGASNTPARTGATT